MRDIAPAGVTVRESGDPSTWRESCWPQERAVVERAVERRRVEFGAVRALARDALAELGIAPAPVLSGARREPLWPPGVLGSLTHCPGYCAAAVASPRDFLGLGIDAEAATPLDERLLAEVCTTSERAAMPTDDTVPWPKVLFSAKEAVYKSWYPVVRRWLGFHDVEISWLSDRTFSAAVQVDAPPGCKELTGAFEVRDGFVRSIAFVVAPS